MDGLSVLVGVLVGLAAGAVGVWLLLRKQIASLEDEKTREESEAKRLQEEVAKSAAAQATAEARAERIPALESELEQKDQSVEGFRSDLETLRIDAKALEERMGSERRSFEEQLEAERRNFDERLASERRSYEERKAELESTIRQAEEKFKEAFDSIAGKALEATNQNFMKLAKATFETEQEKAKSELVQRKQSIDELVKPLSDALKGYEEHLKSLEKSHQERDVQTNERIQQLLTGINQQQTATHELKGLLRGPSTRGRTGEMLLERIFEAAGLAKNLHYYTQQHEGGEDGATRPDFIVKMPGDKEIVIDSKFVLDAYDAAMTTEDDQVRIGKLKEHAGHVKGHIDALAKKPYAERSKNTELVIMFLPLDACLSAAQEVDAEIATRGWDRKIILATPSLLFAVMRMVALDWRQENLRENADEIQKLGKEMVDRIRIAVEHFAGVGDGLDKATRAYNSAVGSIQSQLLTSAYRFQKLEAGKDVRFEQKKLPRTVDREPTLFVKPELNSLPEPDVRSLLVASDVSELMEEPAVVVEPTE